MNELEKAVFYFFPVRVVDFEGRRSLH